MKESQPGLDEISARLFEHGKHRVRWEGVASLLEERYKKNDENNEFINQEIFYNVLRQAEWLGILSREEKGNYGVYSQFHALRNPRLPFEGTYFFVEEREARAYARAVLRNEALLFIKQITHISVLEQEVKRREDIAYWKEYQERTYSRGIKITNEDEKLIL